MENYMSEIIMEQITLEKASLIIQNSIKKAINSLNQIWSFYFEAISEFVGSLNKMNKIADLQFP